MGVFELIVNDEPIQDRIEELYENISTAKNHIHDYYGYTMTDFDEQLWLSYIDLSRAELGVLLKSEMKPSPTLDVSYTENLGVRVCRQNIIDAKDNQKRIENMRKKYNRNTKRGM